MRRNIRKNESSIRKALLPMIIKKIILRMLFNSTVMKTNKMRYQM